jgi:hypothetical protein
MSRSERLLRKFEALGQGLFGKQLIETQRLKPDAIVKCNPLITDAVLQLREKTLKNGLLKIYEDKSNSLISYNHLVVISGNEKQYLISVCLDKHRRSLQIKDYKAKEGNEKILGFTRDFINDSVSFSYSLEGIRKKRKIEYSDRVFTPEEQFKFLKEVQNTRIDMEATRCVEDKDIVF